MTIRIEHCPHPPRACRHSMNAHAITSSTLVPEIDRLVALIAQASGSAVDQNGGLEGQTSARNPWRAVDDSAPSETHGKVRSVSHFPSPVPPEVPANSHSHSPENDLVTPKEKCHACDRSGDS